MCLCCVCACVCTCASCPALLLQRVLFDPNKGDLDKVNDYFANVYFGEVDIAEADPVIAAAGGVVSDL